ncbi:hypothetical protein BGZ46_003020, partial [Entomortierella lignicola]
MKEKLNQEYDTKITEMERIIDALNKQRRMREESDERQKEDQWNLELANQELRSQNSELQGQLSRAVHENSKVQKALAIASEQLEQFKEREERTAGQIEMTKNRHEQDMATMRKHTAGIQREKSDLLKKMEELQTTISQQQQKLTKKATLEAIALAQEKEKAAAQELESPVEAPILIQAPIRIPTNDEVVPTPVIPVSTTPEPKAASLARETSFAHQQSIISELQAKLSKEITEKEQLVAAKDEWLAEKEELAKLLADREETIETMRIESTMNGGFDHPALPVSDFEPVSRGVPIENDLHHQGFDDQEEISTGLPVLRPISPMPVGGLFAELAQASSGLEPAKPAVEYKDQEAMTEPIESWIHTIPGFSPAPAPVSQSEPIAAIAAVTAAAVAATAVAATAAATTTTTSATTDNFVEKAEVETHTIATNTEEKAEIETQTIATNTEVRSLVETNTIATNTEVKSLVDGTTSTETKTLIDSSVSTDVKSLSDSVTSTEDLPTPAASLIDVAPAKVMVDDATSTEDLPTAVVVPVVEKEAPIAKTLVDSSTSTDDLPVAAVAPVTEAVLPQEPAKTFVESTTSTDDLPVYAPAAPQQPKSHRNVHLTDIITRKLSVETKAVNPSGSIRVATPNVSDLEVANARLPEVSTRVSQAKYSQPATPTGEYAKQELALRESLGQKPIPRSVLSDISLDDERRHTCDMSQTMVESSSESGPPPPVPALPKKVSQSLEYPESATPRSPDSAGTEAQDFRVAFGSAFGGSGSNAVMTGQIEPVYLSDMRISIVGAEADSEHQQQYRQQYQQEAQEQQQLQHQQQEQQHQQQDEVLSPGRPSTGPPSNLLARAAARASMASLLENGEVPVVPKRSTSIRSEHHMFGSSPPAHQQQQQHYQQHSRGASSTGAAFISGTSRTAYTFSNHSSQVHIPQQPQQQVFQHITDSSGASIGRSKYRPSPNGSVSSLSTDYGGQNDRRSIVSSNYDGAPVSTDPTMIQIITQTMIGDYLWKYTRRPMASAISEKKHRRYFWVHPYTKTMYWSLNNPAADGSREQRAKSALIINVYQITDESPSGNSDLPNVSLLVQTSNRNLKLTAPTREKHELWYQSLAYLLSRPTTPGADISTDNQTWSEIQASRGVTSDALLTIKNEKAVRKKGSFNRLQTIFGRSKESSPAGSPRSANPNVVVQGSAQHSGVSANHNSGGSGGSIVGYTSHVPNPQSGVGGYGTMNGGSILAHATSSLSPKSRLENVHEYGDEYFEENEEREEGEEEDDDDGELPEHVRQCCD